MRGQAKKVQCVETGTRITPADAGTSVRAIRVRMYVRDHPRGCGDKSRKRVLHRDTCGSPPRMRGQAGILDGCHGPMGITPADAGTSTQTSPFRGLETDHPRGCGDKDFRKKLLFLITGSPPRMRGQVRSSVLAATRRRITPADAGTSTPLCL